MVWWRIVLCMMSAAALAGCAAPMAGNRPTTGARLRAASVDGPLSAGDAEVALSAAKNEWVSFVLEVGELPRGGRGGWVLRVQAPQRQGTKGQIDVDHFTAAQVLPVAVDLNRAGHVRHTGRAVERRPLPRALLPLAMEKGAINLATLRDSAAATRPSARFGPGTGSALVWFDLHVPKELEAGDYECSADLLAAGNVRPAASVKIRVTVHDFALPDQRHLAIVSRVDWEDLRRLYRDAFETVAPRLLNRHDEGYAPAMRTIDALQQLAQAHRCEVVIPRLQPTAKWQLSKPRVDWEDFDSVVGPWMSGEAFADGVGLAHWELPAVDFLDRFELPAQLAYWEQAATHFAEKGWLGRAPVWMQGAGEDTAARAAEILSLHPRVRVGVELEDEQVPIGSAGMPAKAADRLLCAAPGIVYSTSSRAWPRDVARPRHWLRTDAAGLVPYVGAGGDEEDARLWAWLAFLRQAELIAWRSGLPRTDSPEQLADPDELVWFYPGQWWGVDKPLASVQLKWLRRAQQDFEYLQLARERGSVINATLMARLLTKPVQIAAAQKADPTYALMCGTADSAAWSEAQGLLARMIASRPPGEKRDERKEAELNLEMLRWCAPRELPMLLGRSAEWRVEEPGKWLALRVAVDLYNASDMPPAQNLLQWTAVPRGWQVSPGPVDAPALQPYAVQRQVMESRFNLTQTRNGDAQPAELTFTDGYKRRQTTMKMVLPVAASERRPPGLKIDGDLGDWAESDVMRDGPLVRMFNRPAVQKQEMELAAEPSRVMSGWADENFYVAFRLRGVSAEAMSRSRNFVEYEFGRAWGEDLCEILIQPLYADNSVGQTLHLVCKPSGHWVERKGKEWAPLEGTGIRYSARVDGGAWSGEVAIPWEAIMAEGKGLPPLLRFNFAQHVHATGESASWAGPVDSGRDEEVMGIVQVRDRGEPGMAGSER